ncbi:MAG: hypothetical protein EOL87_07905 [Spartobacteria bacterium]|nr:hypothetical protein [Spartobacteria bacterium]
MIKYSSYIMILVLCAVTPAYASRLQITSILPGKNGKLTTEVTLKGKRSPNQLMPLKWFADGVEMDGRLIGDDGSWLRYEFSEPPKDMKQLGVGFSNSNHPIMAVNVASFSIEEAPFNDWIIYHIMVGYFMNGNPDNDHVLSGWKHSHYAGGDLQGVRQKIPYIAGMGFNAVWLSPIFQCDTSHGYDTKNYYQIGDSVGVPEDADASLRLFRDVVSTAHGLGVNIMLDMVLNHANKDYDQSSGDPLQLHPKATGPIQEAEQVWSGWGSNFQYWDMEDANTRQFLFEASKYWLVEEDIDALRLDYVRGVAHTYWAEFYRKIKAIKASTFVMGECWLDQGTEEQNALDIAAYYKNINGINQFDSLIDPPMQMVMTDVFGRGKSVSRLEHWLQRTEALYGKSAQPTHYLDNHDMARFMAWTDDARRLKAALTFEAALNGPMIMFYGTETGLTHSNPMKGFQDASRIAMHWDNLNSELMNQVKAIIAARNAHPSLRRGARYPLTSNASLLVMIKKGVKETALCAVNLTDEPKTIQIDTEELFDQTAHLTNWVTHEKMDISWNRQELTITIPAMSTLIAGQ